MPNKIWEIDVAGALPPTVVYSLSTTGSISQFAWSPNQSRLAIFFNANTVTRAQHPTGYRFDDTMMFEGLFSNQNEYGFNPDSRNRLRIVNISKKENVTAMEINSTGYSHPSWAPDSTKIAIQVIEYGKEKHMGHTSGIKLIKILDANSGETIRILGSPVEEGISGTAAWLQDSNTVLALLGGSRGNLVEFSQTTAHERLISSDLYYYAATQIAADDRSVFVNTSHGANQLWNGLYQVSLQNGYRRRLFAEEQNLLFCSYNKSVTVMACLRQSQSSPLSVRVFDLAHQSVLGTIDVGAKSSVNLRFEPLTVTNRYGKTSTSILVYPANYDARRRYPLVCVVYPVPSFGFRYTTTAYDWDPIAVSVLARRGFFVLEVNSPDLKADWFQYGNFADGKAVLAYGPMDTVIQGIHKLVASKRVDPARVGVVGWSNGGALTHFMIGHTDAFRAAVSGGAAEITETYWDNGFIGRQETLGLFGGPPFDPKYESRYKELSPTLQPQNIHTPLLMNYDPQEAIPGVALLLNLQYLGVPSELYIYPGDGHVLSVPSDRVACAKRIIAWFEFWLLGKRDTSLVSLEDFQRWARMQTAAPISADTSTVTTSSHLHAIPRMSW